MKQLNRRQFLKTSAASCLLAKMGVAAEAQTAKLLDSGQSLTFTGANYRWEWSAETDRFRIVDPQGHVIVSGPIHPAVVSSQWESLQDGPPPGPASPGALENQSQG
jgi:hypothetical protein